MDYCCAEEWFEKQCAASSRWDGCWTKTLRHLSFGTLPASLLPAGETNVHQATKGNLDANEANTSEPYMVENFKAEIKILK